jgi:GNAT superfamily N-acetyltransferase
MESQTGVRPGETVRDPFDLALCGPAEREEQARLFNRCFKKPVDAAALAWRYDQNPVGPAVSLLARPPGGQGVSGYACSPRRALSRGDEATLAVVGETGDVMTDPPWRKRGIFSRLDREAMRETARLGWPLVFGLPNRRSAHIFLELGWEAIGTVRPWTLVLDAGAGGRELRAREGRLRGLLAPLAAWRARAARRRLGHAGRGLEARAIERFPAEVEALSRTVERRFAFMVRRDAAWLDWRFLRAPSGLHRAVGLYDRVGVFAGYALVQVPRPGERLGYLVDLLAADEEALAAALAAGLDALERQGAALVQATAIDGSWWRGVLERSAFQPSRPESALSVILHVHRPEHPLAAAARPASGWYFTDGDRDDETMG